MEQSEAKAEASEVKLQSIKVVFKAKAEEAERATATANRELLDELATKDATLLESKLQAETLQAQLVASEHNVQSRTKALEIATAQIVSLEEMRATNVGQDFEDLQASISSIVALRASDSRSDCGVLAAKC